MPTVTLGVNAPSAAAAERRVTIKLGGEVLTLPITSPEVVHSEIGPEWVQIPRFRQEPLQRKNAARLRQIQMTVMFTAQGRPVEGGLRLLERFAAAEAPLHVAYGPMETGMWRLTDTRIRSQKRQTGTDAITRAEVDLTFQAFSASGFGKPAAPKAAAPARPKVTPSAPAPKAQARTYVVRSGDTLSKISVRFYGTASRFGEIAKANRLSNPNRIRVGQKLLIP